MTSRDQFLSPNKAAIEAAERIYHAWDDALGQKDIEASLALYAENATLRKPARSPPARVPSAAPFEAR